MSRSDPLQSVSPGKVFLGVLLTWLVPGAGHWTLGRRGKAVLYFSVITFVYVLGLVLGEFRNVNLDHFPIHFFGEIFYGGLTIPVWLLTGGLTLELPGQGGEVVLGFSTLDVGVLYTTVAGLLNVCVMVDVFETAYPRPAPAEES